MPHRAMTSTTRGWGRTGPSLWAAAAAQMAPMMNCPSPPMFQKRIRKASDRAREVMSRGTKSLTKFSTMRQGNLLPGMPMVTIFW